MKETLISCKTSVLAKEIGFEWKNSDLYFYKKDNEILPADAVPQSLLQKYLREVHDIDVYVIPNGARNKSINKRLYHPIAWISDEYQTEFESKYSYEEAFEEGLKQAMLIIKNKIK